jgi:hypothetical protein
MANGWQSSEAKYLQQEAIDERRLKFEQENKISSLYLTDKQLKPTNLSTSSCHPFHDLPSST